MWVPGCKNFQSLVGLVEVCINWSGYSRSLKKKIIKVQEIKRKLRNVLIKIRPCSIRPPKKKNVEEMSLLFRSNATKIAVTKGLWLWFNGYVPYFYIKYVILIMSIFMFVTFESLRWRNFGSLIWDYDYECWKSMLNFEI